MSQRYVATGFFVIALLALMGRSYGQAASTKPTSRRTASSQTTPQSASPGGSNPDQIDFWLTDPGRPVLFVKQPSLSFTESASAATNAVIHVDASQTYQTIDGFGYTLTGGSAMLINRMEASARTALLSELFSTVGKGIGVSYLRVSIGASDLDERVFSYDDLPAGETDPKLGKFSLAPDREHLIPVLKQILAINPDLKILGSPWSPPTWMKTNGNSKGGSLKLE